MVKSNTSHSIFVYVLTLSMIYTWINVSYRPIFFPNLENIIFKTNKPQNTLIESNERKTDHGNKYMQLYGAIKTQIVYPTQQFTKKYYLNLLNLKN